MFCFVFVFLLSSKPWPFVQSFFDMRAPRQSHAVTLQLSVSFFFSFFFLFLRRCIFFDYFCIIAVSSLYGDCVVRFYLPDGVFLPCDHGLDLFTSAYYAIIQSINESIIESLDLNVLKSIKEEGLLPCFVFFHVLRPETGGIP